MQQATDHVQIQNNGKILTAKHSLQQDSVLFTMFFSPPLLTLLLLLSASSTSFALSAAASPSSDPLSSTTAASAASTNNINMSKTKDFLPLARKAAEYLTASTDPYWAVQNAVTMLQEKGFRPWTPKSPTMPGGKYYYTVQQSTLVAFTVGAQDPQGTRGFKIVGGHTDSRE